MSLARLLEHATPGPWTVRPGVKGAIRDNHEEHARLVALAPEMARLLIDMAEWAEEIVAAMETNSERGAPDEAFALLARFAVLDDQAKDTT